jgi:hypothetical protein
MADAASRQTPALNLGQIRNEFGGGHGRPRRPPVRDEMVDLALDRGLLWVRWALRRLGLFSEGRPEVLIRDLVEERQIFRAGMIRRRLESPNLPSLEPRHQRALGVTVGQRAMQGTFVVREGGVEACRDSADIVTLWTPDYRIGLANGLLFDTNEQPTVGDQSRRDALMLLDPLPDCSADVGELVNRITTGTAEGMIATEAGSSCDLWELHSHQEKRPT